MFENIGEKLQKSARVGMVLAIIGSVGGGLILSAWTENPVFIILFSLFGIPISIGSARLVYAFGQLVINTDKMAINHSSKSGRSIEYIGKNEQKIEMLNRLKAQGLITESECAKKTEEIQNERETK